MVWQIKFGFRAANDLRLLGFQDAREVLGYLSRWIAPSEDPRRVGRPCRIGRTGTAPDAKAGQWRYEVGGVAMAVKIVDAVHGGPVVWVLALWRTK
jgi:hypothetical protein